MVPTRQPPRLSVVSLVFVVLVVVAFLTAMPPVTSAQSTNQSVAVGVSNVTASPQTPTAAEPFSLSVTITNYEGSGQTAALNQLVVSADGEQQYVADDLGRLTPGSQTTISVPVTLSEPGQRTIALELYGSAGNTLINTRTPYAVDIQQAQRPSLSVSVPDAVTGASREVNVTVANGGDDPIQNVVLRTDSPADAVSFDENARVRGRVAAGETRTFTFPARTTEADSYPVDLSLAYTENGARQTINRSLSVRFAEPANPGRVILSNVETTRRGSTVELSATASNVGGDEVGGVVVSVQDTDTVQPQTYFVGSIDGSGFSSFSLQTRLTGNVSEIPVEVRYTTGGVERSFTTEISVPPAPVPTTPDGSGGALSLGTPIYAIIALVTVVLGGFIYKRRK